MKHRIWLKACLLLTILNNSALAQVSLSDSALQACIDSALSKAGHQNYKQLKTLKCHNKGIKSLSGIEAFTGLENLSLFGNEIEQADVSALAQLTHLNLAKNKLKSINLQGLGNLNALFLFKNSLTTIDFSGVVALQKMRLMENKLVSLDITPLSSIEEIYLWDNQLEDLQITGLTELKFLDLKQNPMPDELYDFYDEQSGITIIHDGNAEDWK